MKPNFLVVLIDDLRYDEFGAGGHPYVRTPNIDRLAHEGALFDLDRDPYEIANLNRSRAYAPVREKLRRELRKLVAEAVGL